MRIKYQSISGGITVTVINRIGDNVTYIQDGFVHHADINWFMGNFKSQYNTKEINDDQAEDI